MTLHTDFNTSATTPLTAVIRIPDDLDAGNSEITTRHFDAVVIGDLEAPEVDALLNQRAVIGTTDRAPRVSGGDWERKEETWADVVNRLSCHPESADKGGNALFFAESDKSRNHRAKSGSTTVTTEYTFKLKDRIRRVYAVAIDVDGGCTVESVVARIRAMGIFAVVYTTHSHTTKGGAGSDRFRVILPLAEAFEMGEGDERKARAAEWEARYVGLCNSLVPEGGEWDFSAARPSQLMYAPARPKGAAFKHYIIAGVGLDLASIPKGDASPYRKTGPSGSARGAVHDGEPAFLSDGFDLMAWHADHGEYFFMESFLEWIGWDVGSSAGEGFETLCPNAAAHSPGTGDAAWAIEGLEADNGTTIFCHHGHCAHLRTWDFMRMLEDQAALPDGFDTLSALICDPSLYPDDVDGEEVEVCRGDYVEEAITITWLKTPAAVKRAFKALSDRSSEAAFAALYAGVAKAGSVAPAVAKLDELMKGLGRFTANDLKRLAGDGRKMLDVDRKAFAVEKAEEQREELVKALTREDLANPSMDPAEPLGDDLQSSLATLAKRFAAVDLDGKFRIVRKPDLEAFKSETDSTIAVYRKEDFLDLHLDRQVMDGGEPVNPAKSFLETEKRKSGLVFAPPPCIAGANDFNMYQGRKLKAKAGTWTTLRRFIFQVICKGDREKFKWLILWMAHMVQRPGDKPGTAVICRGEGGTGKGTFGALLSRLAAPHFKQLEKEGHVIGQFAGEHLSKCILALVTEAVFGANPKVSSELKALVDSMTMQVEAKGLNVVTVPSFIRLYIDSNESLPVLIEGNGSERRYFVLETSKAKKQNLDYFANVRAAIDGDEMAALLDFLEGYDPASAGLTWADVRTAPETPERKLMAWHSLRPPVRRFLDTLRDGEVTLTVEGVPEKFTADAVGLKVPKAAYRAYIEAAGNKARADDSDVAGMFERFFPGAELEERQGNVGTLKDSRWWRFPVSVLGEAVDKVLLGTA